MFTDKDLRELLEFGSSEPVLSVYLNTEPAEGNADAYRLRLRNLLKGVKLPGDSAASIEAVEKYFQQEHNWQGRSMAVFSCAPKNFFRAYPLALPVQSQVGFGERPNVKPLADLLDYYGGYGVVLVDQQGARLFHFHLGELHEQEGTFGEAVKRTKRGGASSMPGRRGGMAGKTRAVEATVDRNMKEAADFAVRFFEMKHVRRILIGGTDDNISLLKGNLPKAWQSLVMGVFHMPMGASHVEVLNRAMEIGQQAELERERKIVKDLIDSAAKGGSAVIGLQNALTALNDGRVQTLVVLDGYRHPGYHCMPCDKLSTTENCDSCEGRSDQVPDVVELAVNMTMRRKGAVEVVHANPEFERAGSIGAMLRY